MRRGRTREFDIDEALDVAVRLFWRHGYDGTSITDLIGEMGINAPSLYAAFGSKRRLFELAADRYLEGRRRGFEEALAQPTAREVAKAFLLNTVKAATRPGMPAGCFNVQAALACGEACSESRDLLTRRRIGTRTALADRFARAMESGDVSAKVDRDALARYLTTVAEGINIQATEGATRAELRAVVDAAMHGFDGATRAAGP